MFPLSPSPLPQFLWPAAKRVLKGWKMLCKLRTINENWKWVRTKICLQMLWRKGHHGGRSKLKTNLPQGHRQHGSKLGRWRNLLYISQHPSHNIGISVVLANASERNGQGAAAPSSSFLTHACYPFSITSIPNKYITVPGAELHV